MPPEQCHQTFRTRIPPWRSTSIFMTQQYWVHIDACLLCNAIKTLGTRNPSSKSHFLFMTHSNWVHIDACRLSNAIKLSYMDPALEIALLFSWLSNKEPLFEIVLLFSWLTQFESVDACLFCNAIMPWPYINWLRQFRGTYWVRSLKCVDSRLHAFLSF